MLATQSNDASWHDPLFDGPDDFRAQLRAHDWRAGDLGVPANWPPVLRDAVALILASPFPMCIVWGESLSFLYNAAYAPLAGSHHPGAIGMPVRNLWPSLYESIAPLVARVRAGHCGAGEDMIYTNRRDGREHQRSFTLSYSALRDGEAPTMGALCVLGESTARVRIEQRQAFQLRVADQLEALTDPAAIHTCASDMLVEYLHVSRVLSGDYNCEQRQVHFHSNCTDGTVVELHGTFDADSFGPANFTSLESGQTWVSGDIARDPRTRGADVWPTFEALGIHAGVVVPHVRAGELMSCLFINASTPRLWSADEIMLIENVAARMWKALDRARAATMLQQADRRKDQFLAMLAHELRNPLAPISAAAELLKMPRLDSERVRATGTVIARQVGHMTALVDDLLDVSRVTSGTAVIAQDRVDLKQVLADALEQVRPLIETRQHHCKVQLDKPGANVTGDYKRLVQVLANLLGNAAKYTPAGGTIEVGMGVSDDTVAVRIADSGQGIPATLLPHVFDLFSQAERSSDRAKGGLGLGLALVKSLVDLHGGTVTAYSEGAGRGSVFTLRLPRVATQHTPPCSATAAGNDGALRLLVVDDNADGAEMLSMYLEASGHTVFIEHTPEQALARAATERFDAFLLDIGLPGMDGTELARRLRAGEREHHAMLVAITGYGHQADGVTALKAGFDHYLVKPVDPAAILALLEGITAVQKDK